VSLGALIGAYQEDDSGGLRALLPLAGRTLVEYQARCAAAAGAAPIVVIVERVPQGLQDAFERLRLDGIGIFPVSDVHEAVTRFESGALILLIGDGVAPPPELVQRIAEDGETSVATVPDDDHHQAFERIDAESRWAGIALVDAHLLGSTAAMLGDWDLQSTLLRRTIQEGAALLRVGESDGAPLLVERPDQLERFQADLIAGSRGVRTDWASRYILPPFEELATTQLLETAVRPVWLVWAALILTLAASIAFVRGWPIAALIMLVLSTPLDLIARRIAAVRLRPMPARMLVRQLLWPAAGMALLGLAWWDMQTGAGWGSLASAVAAIAFARASDIEGRMTDVPGGLWLLSRRNAILAAVPFALVGAWTSYIVGIALYAAAGFFYVQHIRNLPAN
jgi:hypothetical protein